MQTLNGTLLTGDISAALLERALSEPLIAWDIETTGLEWRVDSIGTCQLLIGDSIYIVQLTGDEVPVRLRELLASKGTTKLFHHAPFDVRFMSHHWEVEPANIACTKIAAKIVAPGLQDEAYSLKESLRSYLRVEIDKGERLSDWSRPELSQRQLAYAATDVVYLPRLLEVLEERGRNREVWNLVLESFRYIPSRAALDILGAGDVFSY